MRVVVITSAAFLPILSHISPTTTRPMIAPVLFLGEVAWQYVKKGSYRQEVNWRL